VEVPVEVAVERGKCSAAVEALVAAVNGAAVEVAATNLSVHSSL